MKKKDMKINSTRTKREWVLGPAMGCFVTGPAMSIPIWIIIIVVVLLLLTSCAHVTPDLHPRPWTTEEKVTLGVGLAAAVADCYTTERMLDKGYRELNPLIGHYPSDSELLVRGWLGYTFIVILAHFYPEYRMMLLSGTALTNAGFAAHNSTLK